MRDKLLVERGIIVMIKLKVFRASRNLSGEDMAKVLGVTPASYYNLENGKTDLKVRHIKLIREAFNLSIIEVLEVFGIK
jgi:transcriptional regulator with XRE-family HTH domain